MIISHKFKFIFLKTNKTAGTSVEIALSKFCGPDDIITPITIADEKIRSDLGYRGPQNYLKPIAEYSRGDWIQFVLRMRRPTRFYHHMAAHEILQHLDKKIWHSYFKFCIERNPWDRVVSMYYWHHQMEPRPSISQFMETNAPGLLRRRGYDHYTTNGKVVVDKIYRFERLDQDLEDMRTRVGIPERLVLPHAKSAFRPKKKTPKELLSSSEVALISEMFDPEISLMGYKFD